MSLGNTQRVVLITGANRGIGLETARQRARRRFHVVIAARDERKGHQAADGIRAGGGEATALPLDVSRSDGIRDAVGRFAAVADRLDVLINNAAVYPDQGLTVLSFPRDRLEQTFQTNT